jgi:hypothetical protein
MYFTVAWSDDRYYRSTTMSDWQNIDSNLRRLAKARAALDVEEARWLRAAEAAEVHLYFGCSSVVEYLEVALGYTPKVAVERLRVAHALAELPVTEAAFGDGRLTFSAVRELTRVVTPATEQAWVDGAKGKRVHQVERMVSGHVPGDLPTDPRTPDLETVVLRREVSPGTAALDRQVQRILEDEVGSPVNDDELMVAVYRTFLAARGQAEGEVKGEGRSPHQIVLHVCERCQAGQQVAGGVTFDVHPKLVERALCDAQHLGHVDGSVPSARRRSRRRRCAGWSWRATTTAAACRGAGPLGTSRSTTSTGGGLKAAIGRRS